MGDKSLNWSCLRLICVALLEACTTDCLLFAEFLCLEISTVIRSFNMYWPHSTPVVTDGGEMESQARWRRSLNRCCVIFRLGGIPAAQLCQRAKSLNAKWRLCQNMVSIPPQLSKSPLPSIDQEKEWPTVVYNFVPRGLQRDFMRRWCNPIAHPDDVWKQCRFLGRRYLGMRLLISTLLPDPLNTPPRGEILNLT